MGHSEGTVVTKENGSRWRTSRAEDGHRTGCGGTVSLG